MCQAQGLPRREGTHYAVVLFQQQGWTPGVRAPPHPGLSGHAGQKETLGVGEAQVGQQRQVSSSTWDRDISDLIANPADTLTPEPLVLGL